MQKQVDAFGKDFETTRHAFLDFLLLDERDYPLIVLEAKKEFGMKQSPLKRLMLIDRSTPFDGRLLRGAYSATRNGI